MDILAYIHNIKPSIGYRATFIFSSINYYLLYIAFIIFIHIPHPIISYNDPINEFSTYEVIVPGLYTQHRIKRDLNYLQNKKLYDERITLLIKAFNQTFVINLKRNHHLIQANYFEKHHENGTYINKRPHIKNLDHCHYQGQLLNSPNSWAAISTCNGLISGVFYDGIDLHYIHNKDENVHLLFRNKDLKSNSFKCGSDDIDLSLFPNLKVFNSRHKRSIVSQDPYLSNYKTRYVELLIVNDFKVFKENKSDKELVFDRSKRIANIVNALYNQLNVYIALVGVITWTEKDEITMTSDGDQTLNNFLHYRRERLFPEHPNDNAQLITGSSFDGGVVGKALKGPICTYEYSGGVNTDHSQVIGIVATTMAHELGHNFGMEHDTDKCKCPDVNDKCIMAPSSSSISPKKWSTCSVEYIEDSFRHGMDFCLRNRPRQIVGPVCGNGFVDEGEQCDCGLKDFCDNKCCNSSTCTLMPGAACATGSCCDMSTCRIYIKESNKVCRQATNDCDLAEVCDGLGEFCPEDVHIQDGTSCLNGNAYCYNGQCNSLESQCKLLWGPTGQVSDDRCFLQNTKGNDTGNCGYSLKNKTHKACLLSDIKCGTLHCNYKNERLEFGIESAAILTRSYLHMNGKLITCRSAIVDFGLDTPNPGLAPNGAKCALNSMCVSQKCLPVSLFLSKNPCFQNCNHNGFCDNKGRCHCFSGYAPPYCEYALPGGYFITVALYIIFLCILPITIIGALLIYHYHEQIKTWWLVQARKAVIKSRAKQVSHRKPPRPPANFNTESLEISHPIPLENDYEVINISTLPKTTIKPTVNKNTVEVPLSNAESSSKLLKPVRPAPAPPSSSRNNTLTKLNNHLPTNNLSRSSSNRSSSKSLSRKNSVVRPNHPPPRPPRVNQLNQDHSNQALVSKANSATSGTIVTSGNSTTSANSNKVKAEKLFDKSKISPPSYAKININETTSPPCTSTTLISKKKVQPSANGFKQNSIGPTTNENIVNTNFTSDSSSNYVNQNVASNHANQNVVASLAKKFEKLTQ